MGVLVVLAMLVGLIPGAPVQPTSAVAGTLQFGTVTFRTATALLARSTEVSLFDISPNGSNVMIVDADNGTLKRSSSGGTSEVAITANLVAAGAAAPFHWVAASPDDDNFWAVVTNGMTAVYITIDNGTTWNFTGAVALPAGQLITSVAISGQYQTTGGNARDIVISAADATPLALGTIWVLQLKPLGVGGWTNQLAPIATAFHKVKLAPAYAGDFSIVAVGAAAAGTFLSLGFRDINLNTTTWNTSANYPVNVTNDAVARPSPTFAQIVSADIALPADFSGQVDRMRRVYVSYDTGVAALVSAGVYRVDNYRPYSLASPETRPYSLSYSGSFNAGKLLMTAVSLVSAPAVGGSPSVPVWRTLNAQTSFPTWDLPYKAPTGAVGIGASEARSVAKWKADGKSALLGSSTSGVMNTPATFLAPAGGWAAGVLEDETGMSRTEDDSDSWNQIALIDTDDTVANGLTIYDVAPSADNTQLFVSTVGATNNMAGIWRSKSSSGAIGFSSYERVGTFNVLGAANPIIRIAADKADGSVLFWGASAGAISIVQRSVDSGKFWQNTLPGFIFVDFSAADSNTLFLLAAGGTIRKGTSAGAGFTWGATIDARIGGGNTIEAKGNNVLVGNSGAPAAFLAYSLDGATFTRVMYAVPGGGVRYATMDADFANNKTIYVVGALGGTNRIYRWIIGTNTNEYTTFSQSAISTVGYSSIATGPEKGVVYAVQTGIPAAVVTGPGIDRTVNARDNDPKPGAEFDHLFVGATAATFAAPGRLKVAGKAPNVALYHQDNVVGPDIYSFVDTLTSATPVITTPKDKTTVPVAFNGFAVPFGIHWSVLAGTAQSSGSREYDVQVALMDDFSDLILVAPANGVIVPAAYMPPSATADPSVTVGQGILMGGVNYFMRVRVRAADGGQAIRSLWSPTVAVAVQAGIPTQGPSGGPQALAPVGGSTNATTLPGFSWTAQGQSTEYTFVLSEKADLSSPLVNTTTAKTSFQTTTALKAGTTYFWQVKATKPVAGTESSVFSFTTATPPPPVVTPLPAPTPVLTVVVPPAPVQGTPSWVWIVIGIGALLVIVTIVLIFRTRRV